MNDDRGSSAGTNLNRRDFLAAGALPLAGALDSASLSKSSPFMVPKQQGPIRLGFIGAATTVRKAPDGEKPTLALTVCARYSYALELAVTMIEDPKTKGVKRTQLQEKVEKMVMEVETVSYTHLTLPTILLV